MNLEEYVLHHSTRTDMYSVVCDTEAFPMIDLTFFRVATMNNPSKETFENLARKEYPELFDGVEHNYIELGSKMGDQGIALMTMALGHLLDVWTCFCPETIFPEMPYELKKELAGAGLISILYHRNEPTCEEDCEDCDHV